MQTPRNESAVTLPAWLRVFYLAVAEAPLTNMKVLNALLATNFTLVFLGVSSIFKWELNEALVDSVLIFLASWLGITMIGSIGKRMTYKPAPPYGPDIEDAAAGATVTDEHSVPKVPRTGERPAFGGKSR